jgi:hypothetical protein
MISHLKERLRGLLIFELQDQLGEGGGMKAFGDYVKKVKIKIG